MTAPKRIQLRRTKGWRKPEGAIVVARPSRWGNPYRAGDFPPRLCVELYRETLNGFWSRELLAGYSDDVFQRAYVARDAWLRGVGGWAWYRPIDTIRAELSGHDLACWCPLDQPCHADVLLALANPGWTP